MQFYSPKCSVKYYMAAQRPGGREAVAFLMSCMRLLHMLRTRRAHVPTGGSAGAAGLCSCAGTAQREQNPAEDAQTTRQGHHTATATPIFFFFFSESNITERLKRIRDSWDN